ncbi:MAG: hypothetical protein AAFO85_19390 [Cyanobacteria bacterium J06598_4]
MSKNYEPCFNGVSNDWQGKWALIREFTTKWHGIQFRERIELLPLVKQEEDKLGLKLPPSFREYIIFYADIDSYKEDRFIKGKNEINYSLFNHKYRNIIRDDYTINYLEKLSSISLLRLSEGDCFWGIKLENLAQVDPPVENYMLNDLGRNLYDEYALSGTIKEDGFKYTGNYSPSITCFILDMILLCIYGNQRSYTEFKVVNSELISAIEDLFNRQLIMFNLS